MTELLDALYGAAPTRQGPGLVGKIILVILWVGVCAFSVVLSLPDIDLATGRTGTPGTPGTLTVISCEALGEGRYDCKGSFLPDSGGPAIPVDASPDSDAGEVIRAQLTPAGDRAVPAGTKGLLAALAVPAVGVGGIGFLPYVLLHWAGIRRGRRAAVTVGSVLAVAGLAMAVVGVAASVA
ncbi:hypothetical protein Aph01nite_04970 [Acrocarpospora phusangensis]|uniref:Uncharacterized protein n=1 Tax=Acrocarpospora phusangensis TaxID=1070424 RepID=A0A919ULH1_9ACTN|nr:hypothetical protein [Acrocarpospora phusangensis]GIH22187.1 hypothetical protein Aph01nite_04970 [Acrocarpospora phusangensis]